MAGRPRGAPHSPTTALEAPHAGRGNALKAATTGDGFVTRRGFLATSGAATTSMTVVRTAIGRAADGKPVIERICRDAWDAKPPRGDFARHHVRRITVHHSAVVLRDNRDAPSRLRDHQSYHQSRGWPDIAYHVVIDRHGHVYKGRPSWARGDTATSYDPSGHLLVMCEGNFGEQSTSRAQLRALIHVLAWASKRFDVSPRKIAGHRDFAATACPGARLYRLIEDGVIEQRVRRRLRAGGVAKSNLCGRTGRRRVAAIERGDA